MRRLITIITFGLSIAAMGQTPTYRWVGGSQEFNQGPTLDKTSPGPRQGASSYVDSNGDFWLFGGTGHDFTSTTNFGDEGYFNDVWKYDRNSSTWTWIDGGLAFDKAVPDYNNSLSFDGVNDYAEIPEDPIDYTKDFTIEVWIKPNQDGAIMSYAPDLSTDDFTGWNIQIVNSGTSLWIVRECCVRISADGLNLNDGNWHHLAVVFEVGDDLFVGDKLTLIVDGVEYVGDFQQLVDENELPLDHLTNIGVQRGDNDEFFFDGLMDEVRFWNYARTFGEIESVKNIELSGNEKGLEAYYDFNQGIANNAGNVETEIHDRTSAGLNAIRNDGIYRDWKFIGEMAKVRTWSAVLTTEEIRNARRNVLNGSEPNLAMAYQFDNGNETITPEGDNTAVSLMNDISTGDDGFLNNFGLNGPSSNFVEDEFEVISYIYDSNSDGTGIVVGDLNGDTYDDVITSHGWPNMISVFAFNPVFGQLDAKVDHAVGTYARDLTTGHFNNDANLDIAVAAWETSGDERIRLFYGDGTGGFSSTNDISLAEDSEPSLIRTADFNNDMVDDILVVLAGEDSVEVHFGDGLGGFSAASFNMGFTVFNEALVIDDFNDDSFPDVVVSVLDEDGTYCPKLGILVNDQLGGFNDIQYFPTFCYGSREIRSTDINGDGTKDIIVIEGNAIMYFSGNGDGTFLNNPTYSFFENEYFGGFQLSDANSDDILDAIALDQNENTVTIFTNDGSGNFTQTEKINIPSSPEDIVIADLDKNGVMDYLITGGSSSTSLILREGDFFEQPSLTPSLNFDGIDDHIDIPNLKVFDSGFTIEGWIKTEDNGPIFSFVNSNPVSEWNIGNFSFAIKDGLLTLMVYGYEDMQAYNEANVTNGKWHHVAATIEVNVGAGDDYVNFFVDGVNVGSRGQNFDSGIDNANGSFYAKLGIAAMPFSGELGSTGLSPNSNFVDGIPFPEQSTGRAYAAEWTDGSNIFVFGGEGINGVYNTLRAFDLNTEIWSTLKGSETAGDLGSYGILDISDPTNVPPARWIVDGTLDPSGNFWVFGGAASQDPVTWFNDLWMYDSNLNEWTWKGGTQNLGELPVYGTMGVANPSNAPGARENNIIWSDGDGNLWVFGGYGLDVNGDEGFLNDLWKRDATSGEWVWVAGSDVINQGGTYGTTGQYSTSNYPGSRAASLQWTDSNGIIWVFGGRGYDKFGVGDGHLNDLWSYNPNTNQWAWHSGSDFAGSTGSYNETGLSSVDYVPGARWHGSEWIDENDELWLFGGFLPNQVTTGRFNDFWKYQPETGEWTWISGENSTTTVEEIGEYGDWGIGSKPFPGARHGALSWTDPNGDFWILGGAFVGSSSYGMLTDLWKYAPNKDEWTFIRGNTEMDLNDGVYGALRIGNPTNEPKSRWHGVSWAGDDGKLWFFGGLNQNKNTSTVAWLNDLWVYDPASDVYTWMGGSSEINGNGVYGIQGESSTAHIPGPRSSSASWKDSDGNFWLFGGYESFEYNNDLWRFNPNTLEWTWMTGNNFQNTPSSYGTKYVEDPSNEIGARRYTDAVVDREGNVWVFGGQGYDGQGQFGYLNDLWKYNPESNLWTWMAGDTEFNQIGNYGTKGVSDPNNVPAGRYAHTTWIDDVGNIWLFGGFGIQGSDPETFTVEYLNDLWKYDVRTNEWIWMGGNDQETIPAGVYGTERVFDVNNVISARQRTQKFDASDKSLFLFGGRQGSGRSHNDFWEIKFTPGEAFVESPSTISQSGFEFSYEEAWAREYQLQLSSSSDFSSVITDAITPEKTQSINSLDPGTYYYYRVNAINEIGESGFGAANSVLTLPATPTFASLEAALSNLTSTQVDLGWEVTEGILDGYFIDVSQDPTFSDANLIHEDFDNKMIEVSQQQEILNLNPGTKYYARLQSYNASGFSTYSQAVPFLTKPETVIYPEEVVTDITLVSAVVNWEPVSGIVDNYQITVSTIDDGFVDETQYLANYNRRSIPKDRTSITIEGLESGTSYFAIVSAVNASGESEQPFKITILTAPSSPVFDVESSILSISQRDVTLNWESPNGFFEGYQLEVSIDQSFVNTNLMLPGYGRGNVPFELGQGDLTTTVSDLIPGLTYYARIRAFNDAGVSPNSNILAFTTVPKAPVISQINNISQTEAFVKWQSTSGTDVYLMDVNTSPGFEAESEVLAELPLAVTLENLEGLAPGIRYFVRVQASNSSGDSGDMTPDEYSDAYGEANFITIPSDPVITEITYGQESVILNWSDVIGIDTYEVDASENFFLSYIDNYEALNITDSEIAIEGLDAGTEYQVRVRSKNESGESSYAQILDLLTLPATPTARDASNSSASVFTANWDAANGADYYVLEVSNDDFQTFHYNEQLSSSNPEKIENLVAGSTYKYRVKAGNESGESPYSSEVTVIAQNTAQSLSISSLEFNDKFSETSTSAVVTVTFSGGVAEPEVTIRHREILSSSWSGYKAMTRNSATEFQFTILSNMLDDIGVEFEIKADDDVTFIEQRNNKIKRTFTETSSEPLPDIDLGQWSMISIPYVLDDNLVLSIFNELGDLQYKKRWRLMTYLDGTYQDQGVGFTRIDLGRGYWFNSLNDVTISVGAGETNSTIPFEMALAQGWNQIGNPYNVSIDWDEILDENSLSINIGRLIIYDPVSKEFKESRTLLPFSGAFVFADEATVLSVSPVAGSTITARTENTKNETSFKGDNWMKKLNLNWGGKSREIAAIGMHEQAQASKDQFDKLVVPRFENYLEMYTSDNNYFYPKFSHDIKSQTNEQVWIYDLESNHISGLTELTWDPDQNGNGRLWLVDETNGKITEMSNTNSYSFAMNGHHQFSMHYSEDPNYQVVPTRLALGDIYPNPVNALAQIPLLLPKQSESYDLSLNLYNLNGQLIENIASGVYSPGIYVFDINIEDLDLKDGMYFYGVTFKNTDQTPRQKKIIIKR